MAQAVAHFIGNEEVTGSSPVVSFFYVHADAEELCHESGASAAQ